MSLPWHRAAAHGASLKEKRRPRRRAFGFSLCTERLEDRLAPAASLNLPASGFTGATNSTVMNFPIGISALSDGAGHVGLASATLAVTYPTGVFNFPTGGNQATAEVSLGAIPLSDTAGAGGASDWTLTANSPADGQLNITLTAKNGDKISTNTFPSGGTLVAVNFPILAAATPGNETIGVVSVNGSVHTQVFGGGSGSQTYQLTGLPASGTIVVTAGVQNPPNVPATESYSTEANTPLTQAAPGLLTGASDPQGEALSLATINGSAVNAGAPLTLPSGATLAVHADGSFVYTPSVGFVGSDSFTFQAIDTGGSLSNTSTVTIEVTPTLTIVPRTISSGAAGTTIEEDIYLDNPNPPGGAGPLSAFNLVFSYDSTALATASDGSGIHAGPDLPADFLSNFLANVSTPGVIGMGTFGSGSGADLVTGPAPLELASIEFNIVGKTTESTPIELVATAQAGTVMIATTVTGAGGAFAINPHIGPQSSGFVTGVDTLVSIQGAMPLTLSPTALTRGDFDAAYNQTITASGGAAPYTYTVLSGTLPPGLMLDGNSGVLSGTATAAGSFTFTIRAIDAESIQGVQTYTLTIMSEVSITTSPLADWTADNPGYSQIIAALGGVAPFTFAATSGTLPPGLTLSSTGLLSGTPSTAGVYTFTVAATDSTAASGSQAFAVTINPLVAITTTTLPNAISGAAYDQTVFATGGTGSLTFTSSGTLPPGLMVSSSGVLSGSPTTGGSFAFTITATDAVSASASQTYTILINPITITTATLANWTVNLPGYVQAIATTGGVSPLTFSATGILPAGLTLSSDGLLSGTPTAAGTFDFTVTVADSISLTGSRAFVVVINPAVSILTATLAPWTMGQAGYLQTVLATGGTGSLVFSGLGNIPPGLTLSSAGVLSGTPSVAGSYQFVVTVNDAIRASTFWNYTVTINPLLTIGTSTLANWTVNQAGYHQTIAAMGGTRPVTFAETGTLPPGLTLSTAGVLSGTPTATGTYSFSVTGIDASGATAISHSINLTIDPLPVLQLSNPGPGWPIDQPGFAYTITAAGGTAPVTFSATGTLPPGLTLSSAGVLAGTPTASGSYTFTIIAADVTGATNGANLTITINPAVNPTSLPDWTVNVPGYNQTITLAGGVAPFTFGVAGTLPAGLTLGPDGVLAGTPTAVGSYHFVITASDSVAQTESQNYTVVINPALAISPSPLPNGAAGQAGYAQQIVTTGGTGNVTFSTSGTLPPGLTVSSSGKLSGKPTLTGMYTFVVTATDSVSATVSQSYTIVIETPVTIATTTLAAWTVNIAGYSQTISATGGTGLFTFTNAGTLPPGLRLSGNGVLSGTPSSTGLYTFFVTAVDALGVTATVKFSVEINPALTFSTPTTLPSGVANPGSGYGGSLVALGGTGSVFFSFVSGSFPPNLYLSGLSVTESGMPDLSYTTFSGSPILAGWYTFTVMATDSVGSTATRTFSLYIALSWQGPYFISGGTADYSQYGQYFGTAGGNGTVTFSTAGQLPPGLTVSKAGHLSGIPTIAGTYSFTVIATDSLSNTGSWSYTVTIAPAPKVLTTTLPNARVSLLYSQVIEATGGTGTLTLSTNVNDLPAGLTFSSNNAISGIPTAAGTSIIEVTATDSVGATAHQILTLMVTEITFSFSGSTSWTVNQPGYNLSLVADGAIGPSTFTETGTLPPGLTFTSSGVLSGTPLVAGQYYITVTVADSVKTTQSLSFTVTINAPVQVGLPVNALATITNGYNPTGGLVRDNNGDIFGTTEYGGDDDNNYPYEKGYGTVFELPKGSNNTITLGVFNYQNGAYPAGRLVLDSEGDLFGTTSAGGPSRTGSIFEVKAGSNTITTLGSLIGDPSHPFSSPMGGLVEDSDGNLYGTTQGGGLNGYGGIFELAAGSSNAMSLGDFTGANGAEPTGSLVVDSNGNVFGTTSGDNDLYYGNLFELPEGSHTIVNLANFSTRPFGGVIEDSKGDLIGTTFGGGAYGVGSVFEFEPGIGLITLASFDGANGAFPGTGVIEDSNGNLFGVAGSGGRFMYVSGGTVYEIAAGSSTISDVVLFNPLGMAGPTGLIEDNRGDLFGTTQIYDANYGIGTVFELPALLPDASFEQPGYDQTIATDGGTGSSSFVATGTLPPGIALSDSGILSGTPTAVGDFTFTVTGTDSTGASNSKTFTLTVDPAITPAALAGWTLNQPNYIQTLDALGGARPYSFSTTGTLPPGVSMSSGGLLSGTPTSTGSFTFTVSAADSSGFTGSQTYTVTINPAVTLATSMLTSAVFEQPGYAQTIMANGGTGSFTFASSSALPSGLSLSSNGVLSGTPTAVGVFTFTVTATDSTGASAAGNIAVTVSQSIMPFTLPNWTVNQPGYNQTLVEAGGTAPYTFVNTGTIPPGLTLTSNGVLFGMPTAVGSFVFTVKATDSMGGIASQRYTITVTPALAITTSTLPGGVFDQQSYSQPITTSGGTGSVSFSATGSLPPGLTLSSGGVLSGTPAGAGMFSFTVTASDSTNASTSRTVTVLIHLNMAPATLSNWTLNLPGYGQTISASGGTAPYVFAVSGALPPGLTLSSSGLLSGTPSAAGSYRFAVVASDGVGNSGAFNYNVTINPIVTITSALASAVVGVTYNQSIAAAGGTGALTFTATGTLPPGLTLSSSGVLSGTPTAIGSFSLTITATDTVGASGSQAYTLPVTPDGGTFVWTGNGTNNDWSTGGNWAGGVAPTGNGTESLVFPGGAMQLGSVDDLPTASNAFNSITFAGADYSLLLNNVLTMGVGGIYDYAPGTDTINALAAAWLALGVAQAFASAVPGANLEVMTAITNQGNTLTIDGSGAVTLAGVLSGAGGLTASETVALTLSGANTYTGPTVIDRGATVEVLSTSALGGNSAVTVNGTLNAGDGPGLAGTYYSWASSFNPQGILGNPPPYYATGFLSNYASILPVLAQDNSATPNGVNTNGAFFDYGASGAGFPSAVVSSGGGQSFMAIWQGYFYAPTTAVYDFDTGSADGSVVYIDGTLAVDNNANQNITQRDSLHPYDYNAISPPPTLTAGAHTILIAYWQADATYGLYADVSGGGLAGRIPNTLLSPTLLANLQLGSLAGTGTVNLGITTLIVGSNNASTTFSGTIGGPGTLTKAGSGTLVVTGGTASGHAGATVVASGTLQFGDGGGAIDTLASAAITDNGTLVLDNPSDQSLTYSGSISGTGGVTQIGAWSLSLGGNNSYSGPTSIAPAATVNALSNTALGDGDVTLPAGATLNEPGFAQGVGLTGTYYDTRGAINPQQIIGNPPNASLTGLMAYAATLPVLAHDTSAQPNGVNDSGAFFDYGMTGNGFPLAVRTNDSGQYFMAIWQGFFYAPSSGVYDFDTGSDDGSVIYVDGNLVVDSNSGQGFTKRDSNNPLDPFATTAPTLTAGAHSILIAYYQGVEQYGLYADVTGGGLSGRIPNTNLGVAGISLMLGSLSGAGTVNLNGNTIAIGGDNNSTTFSGVINGAPFLALGPAIAKQGAGTLTLNGPDGNTYSGLTAVENGTLKLDKPGGAGFQAIHGDLLIAGGAAVLDDNSDEIADTATVTLQGFGSFTLGGGVAETIGSLASTSNNSSITLANSSSLTTGGGASSTFAGGIAGSGQLTKAGTTTFTLSGDNTYTGPTLILDGTLMVNGTLEAAPNPVSLTGPSSVLDGNGSVLRQVLITSTATGAMIGGSLTISNAGGVAVDVNAGPNNVTVSGISVTNSNVGILAEPGNSNHLTITDCTITGNLAGLEALNGCITATGNIIGSATGAGNNVGVYLPAVNPNNAALPVDPVLTLEGNQIIGNTTALQNATGMGVTAILNWWGSSASAEIGPHALGTGNSIVGLSVDEYTPYVMDATSAGPTPTTFDVFQGTGGDGNIYVSGTLGPDIITASVDSVNTNLIHVSGTIQGDYLRGSGSNRVIIYSFGDTLGSSRDVITVSGSWNAEIHTDAMPSREPLTFAGLSSSTITTTGSGSDVIFGGGNDTINADTSGNNVVVAGLSTGRTGAPTAPLLSGGSGANIYIAGSVDDALAPLSPSGRLDYDTLRGMDDLWAAGLGGETDAMSASALFSVANMPAAILSGSARATILPGNGKSWFIAKGAGNPVNTPTGIDADYIAGSTASLNYRQALP